MKRTYNVFVDNGLYVLAYYLDKEVKDITLNDIENSIDKMCEKIETFTNCGKYTNLKSMMFSNSTLTQSNSDVTLSEKMRVFLNVSKGEEYCAICGQHYSNIINSEVSRSYMPNGPAHTFFNFSNNFKGVNVCPYCIILTMYSILNARVSGLAILYNSDMEDFMEKYTDDMQKENRENILANSEKDKSKSNTVDSFTKTMRRLLEYKKVYNNGYVEQHLFNNSGQTQIVEQRNVDDKRLKLINNLSNKSLLNEFIQMNLMDDLLKDRLSSAYIFKLIDFEKMDLKCKEELLKVLHGEVNDMDEKTISVVKNMTKKIKTNITRDKIEKIIIELKNLNSAAKFDDFLVKLIEYYEESQEDSIMTIDEYTLLNRKFKYKDIRNLILVGLILNE